MIQVPAHMRPHLKTRTISKTALSPISHSHFTMVRGTKERPSHAPRETGHRAGRRGSRKERCAGVSGPEQSAGSASLSLREARPGSRDASLRHWVIRCSLCAQSGSLNYVSCF